MWNKQIIYCVYENGVCKSVCVCARVATCTYKLATKLMPSTVIPEKIHILGD